MTTTRAKLNVQGEQIFRLSSLLYRNDKGGTLVLNRTLGQY